MNDAERKLQRFSNNLRKKGLRVYGLLGNFSNGVEVSGKSGWYYVRIQQAGSNRYSLGEFQGNVRPLYNLPVVIEQDPITGEQYIVGTDQTLLQYGIDGGNEEPAPSELPLHANYHGWGGDDQIDWIHPSQIFPLRVQPSATAKHVIVQGGLAPLDGGWVAVSSSIDVDLTSYWPVTGTSYVLLYLSTATTVTVSVCGTNLASVGNPPPGKCALAAVRLSAVLTAVSWTDIVDMRFLDNLAFVEELGTEETDTEAILRPDGGGGLAWDANDHLTSPDGTIEAVATDNSGDTTLAGSLLLSTGETVDGVDLSAHAADANAHHTPPSSATESTEGIIELATTAEVQTGTDTERAITPAGLRADVPATPAASRGVRLDASGHLMLPALGDIYPDDDGRGLMTRLINGGIAYDEHFRGADTIPAGYAWQGSPFAAPTTATYNHLSDFLYVVTPNSSREFMGRAVTNAAANWQSKALYGRFTCGSNGRIGLRFDDGTDNNYAQVFVDGTANDGTETLKFQYRDGGGAVVTNTSAILLPAFTFVILRLYMYWTGTQYQAYGYLFAPEIERSLNITGFSRVEGWPPAAGRAGIFVENPTASAANPLYCDWFKNELV